MFKSYKKNVPKSRSTKYILVYEEVKTMMGQSLNKKKYGRYLLFK